LLSTKRIPHSLCLCQPKIAGLSGNVRVEEIQLSH
jgi:hypothetical protein